jgi:hypothetical protein
MKIIITNHARDRILQRVGCRKEKVEKVTKKAYNSKEKIREGFLNKREFNGYKGSEWRMFQGCVFVFVQEKEQAILVTCLKYDN